MDRNILVVEDDELSQFVIVEMCRELGYDCRTADNGQQALDTLAEHANSIDLVLMDIHMPVVSGLTATSALRELPDDPPQGTPVIAVTADVTWHDIDRCKQHGFNAVLQKPVSIDLLSETLHRYAVAS